MTPALSTHLFVQHRLTTVALDKIQNAGFPLVEIFCARQHLDYHNLAQVGELRHWFRDSGLKLHSLHMPMYTDDVWGRTGPNAVVNIAEMEKSRRIASVDEIKRALEVAEQIPCTYAIQHVGVGGEEFDERKLEAAFSSLEELNLFARQRGVEVLLENIPNKLSSAERLNYFLGITHLRNGYCFDTGHAHIGAGVGHEFELMKHRIRSTHIHDNDGERDIHLFPFLAEGGSIDWNGTMALLRSRPGQYVMMLELREAEGMEPLLEKAAGVRERLHGLGRTEEQE
ncbi:MAG: sugar phosphate isomerase/epimerase [Bryobacterales bacterium]|nr:sugar phosphate isomerase/epimerase [Bryobacterales bacterium]